MALVILSATSLVGVGWIGHDLATGSTATTSNATAVTPVSTPNIAPVQQGQQTQRLEVTGDEPAALVAEALGPAVVKIGVDDGLGSGVVYDSQGYILTNAHVVGNSDTVTVVFRDGTEVEAEVIGSDPSSDIAVVKVESLEHGGVAALAQEAPTTGQTAIAVGSPYGLEQTVTSGIISAIDRPVCEQTSSSGRCLGSSLAINMIQTDAPINPGNSGGALSNRNGEVIGINTAIYSSSGGNDGIGFAIPIATAKSVADKIVNGESLDKGSLGVTPKEPTDGSVGVQISSLTSGGPAANAGLKRNDIITKLDGQTIKSVIDLQARIAAHSPGDVVKVEISRGGDTSEVEVTLGKR